MSCLLKIWIFVLAFIEIHNTFGQNPSFSTAAIPPVNLGCLKVRHILAIGSKVLARNEFYEEDMVSCEEACMTDENCIAWSYNVGKNMTFMQMPQVPDFDDAKSKEFDHSESSCYHIFNNETLSTFSMHYSFGATFSTKCHSVSLGCYSRNSGIKEKTEVSSNSMESCIGQCAQGNNTFALYNANRTCTCQNSLGGGYFVDNETCVSNLSQLWITDKQRDNGQCLIGKYSLKVSNADVSFKEHNISKCIEDCFINSHCLIWYHNGSHCTFNNKMEGTFNLSVGSGSSLCGFGTCVEHDLGLLYHMQFDQPALKVRYLRHEEAQSIILPNEANNLTIWKPTFNFPNRSYIVAQLVGYNQYNMTVLFARDNFNWALRSPHSFELLWSDGVNISVWQPACFDGYAYLGSVVTSDEGLMPCKDQFACIHLSLLREAGVGRKLWSIEKGISIHELSIGISSLPGLTAFIALNNNLSIYQYAFGDGEADNDSIIVFSQSTNAFETKIASNVSSIRLSVITNSTEIGGRKSMSLRSINIGIPDQSYLDKYWTVSGIELSGGRINSLRLYRRKQGIALVPPSGTEHVVSIDGYTGKIIPDKPDTTIHVKKLICPNGYHGLGEITLVNDEEFNASRFSCIHHSFLRKASLMNKPWWPQTRHHNISFWRIMIESCLEEKSNLSVSSHRNDRPTYPTYLLKKHRDGHYSRCYAYDQKKMLVKNQIAYLEALQKQKEIQKQMEMRMNSLSSSQGFYGGSVQYSAGPSYVYSKYGNSEHGNSMQGSVHTAGNQASMMSSNLNEENTFSQSDDVTVSKNVASHFAEGGDEVDLSYNYYGDYGEEETQEMNAGYHDFSKPPEFNISSLKTYNDASQAFYGWGCLDKRDFAILGQEYPPEHGYSLWERCEEVCNLDDNCLSWSVVPESLDDGSSSSCYHVFNDTLLTTVTVVYYPGAFMGLRNCKPGYIGCFQDQSNNDLDELVSSNSYPEQCAQECGENAYFGVQNGSDCWCGNSFGKYWQSSDSDCSSNCQRVNSKFCGAKDMNSVYRTGKSKNEEMCLLGNLWIDFENQSSIKSVEEYSLKECLRNCQMSDFGDDACVLWTHNGTHCILVPRFALIQQPGVNTRPGNYVGNARAFIGFPFCREMWPEGFLYEDRYSQEHKSFDSKKTKSATSMSSLVPLNRQRPENGVFLWKFLNSARKEKWLMLGFPYSLKMDETDPMEIRIVRPVEGAALKYPLALDLIGKHKRISFYKPICPTNYHSLGDVAIEGEIRKNEKNNFACVHENFVTKAKVEFILKNLSVADEIDKSFLYMGHIYSLCKGENLSHIVVYNATMLKSGRALYSLKRRDDEKHADCDGIEDVSTPGVPVTTSTPYATSQPPKQNTMAMNEGNFDTAGKTIKGWGCFKMRHFAAILSLDMSSAIDPIHDKEICIRVCKRNPKCTIWSFIPAVYSSNGDITDSSKCHHIYEYDLMRHIKIVYVKDAFLGFTDCTKDYIGCFKDNTFPRDLPDSALTSKATVKSCQKACAKFAYFGLQFGRECWCGNTFGRYGYKDDSACSAKCVANPEEMCGHSSTNSLYRTGTHSGDMCMFAQAALTLHVSSSTPEGTPIYECWAGCRNKYQNSRSDPCLIWQHNGTHCHRLSRSQITRNSPIIMRQQNSSYIGFSKCNDFHGSFFHKNVSGMEMSVKQSTQMKKEITIANDNNEEVTAWSAHASEGYHILGQSYDKSHGFVAKAISGTPLIVANGLHNVMVDHVRNVPENQTVPGISEEYASFWHLDCPQGYTGLGDIIATENEYLSKEQFRCVHENFVDEAMFGSNLWNQSMPDEASVWSVVPKNEVSGMDSYFFKTLDHQSPPEEEESNLATLKKTIHFGQEYYYLNLSESLEFETRKTRTLDYHSLVDGESTVKIFKQTNLDRGYFHVGFGQGLSVYGHRKHFIASNINGEALIKPEIVERIISLQSQSKRFSVWRMICPKQYRALSDILQEGESAPSSNNLACVHEHFVTPAISTDVLWRGRSLRDGIPYSVIHIMPENCSTGEDLGFFFIAKDDSRRNHSLYTLKREPGNTFYPKCSDWVPPVKVITEDNENGSPLSTDADDAFGKGRFGKFHILLKGHEVDARNEMNFSDPILCQEICQKNNGCMVWSYYPSSNSSHDLGVNNSLSNKFPSSCYHIYQDTNVTDITLEYKLGAISSSILQDDRENTATCIFNATLSFGAENNFQAAKQSIPECQDSCSERYSAFQNSPKCILWLHNGSHCFHLNNEMLSKKVSISPSSTHHIGFAQCKDESFLYLHTRRKINPSTFITSVVEVLEFPKIKTNLIPKNKSGKISFWNSDYSSQEWKIVGQKIDNGGHGHNSGVFAIRNIAGKGSDEPVSANLVATLNGYKRHHDIHSGIDSNISLWRLNCQEGFHFMGDIASYDSELDLTAYACISKLFLQTSVIGENILSHQQTNIHLIKNRNGSVPTSFYRVLLLGSKITEKNYVFKELSDDNRISYFYDVERKLATTVEQTTTLSNKSPTNDGHTRKSQRTHGFTTTSKTRIFQTSNEMTSIPETTISTAVIPKRKTFQTTNEITTISKATTLIATTAKTATPPKDTSAKTYDKTTSVSSTSKTNAAMTTIPESTIEETTPPITTTSETITTMTTVPEATTGETTTPKAIIPITVKRIISRINTVPETTIFKMKTEKTTPTNKYLFIGTNASENRFEIKEESFESAMRSSQGKTVFQSYDWSFDKQEMSKDWLSLGQIGKFSDDDYTTGFIVRNLGGLGVRPAIAASLTSGGYLVDNTNTTQKFAVWTLECDNDYHSLGDIVVNEGGKINWKSYACVHEDYLEEISDFSFTKIPIHDKRSAQKIVVKSIRDLACYQNSNYFHLELSDVSRKFFIPSDFINSSCLEERRRSMEKTAQYVELLQTSPKQAKLFTSGYYITSSPTPVDIPDFDYYGGLPIDVPEVTNKEFGREAWGCVVKKHILIGYDLKAQSIRTTPSKCRNKCRGRQNKCYGWSFDIKQSKCYIISPNQPNYKVSVLQNAFLRVNRCEKEVTEGDSPAHLCIFTRALVDMKVKNIEYIAEKQLTKCHALCLHVERKNCWLWGYNGSHCARIPIKEPSLSFTSSDIHDHWTLGFPTCGKEDESLSALSHADSRALGNTDSCNEETQVGFMIAFSIILLCLMLSLCWICLKRHKKNVESVDTYDKSVVLDKTEIEANRDVVHMNVTNAQPSSIKKSQRSLFARSGIPIIRSLRSAEHHRNVNDLSVKDGSMQVSDTTVDLNESRSGLKNEKSRMIMKSKLENGADSEDYIKYEAAMKDSEMRRYSKASTGRTFSSVSFQVHPAHPSIDLNAHGQKGVMYRDGSTKRFGVTEVEQRSGDFTYFDASENNHLAKSVVEIKHQPGYNMQTYAVGDAILASSSVTSHNSDLSSITSEVIDQEGTKNMAVFVEKYGFIPINEEPEARGNLDEGAAFETDQNAA